ncbi:helix-turn-helix domain-containing protein [Longimicrobium terrae]|uniref:DNA-binding XRE family transcriptional regulator n=1 Tax=Longimicrobium terrae TaxID=1639882 RepID=A0A841GXD5_9BACT|nr:helix-turn-helix transcriptional regulator [Longimicrobium terrae]MBB4635642.1 DNA-binding XRE family transcriptional regulator [Longimicrobium terrae]MBB6070036.1 DNA-binding XRE family transcriptional regulator [Longimicrobium terrae]NNC32942.1 helix-turn-helix transcriptional regulator [Longimicrobium terrae]
MPRLHRHRIARASDSEKLTELLEIEMLRQVVRRELRTHAGQRTLAREIGVHRTTIRKFAEGQSTPEISNLAEIREWASDRPRIEMPMALVALAVLMDDLPPASRPAARQRFASLLMDLYEETGEGIPTWVTDELRGLDRPRVGE